MREQGESDSTKVASFLVDLRYQLVNQRQVGQQVDFSDQDLTKEERRLMQDIWREIGNLTSVENVWFMDKASITFKPGEDPASPNNEKNLFHATINNGAKVVVKAVKEPSATDIARFEQESSRWYKLRHPNILPLYAAYNKSPLLYVMEDAELGDFRSHIQQHPDRFWQLFLDAARGLDYLHEQKIVHGNLKCNNLLVLANGRGVISDFSYSFVRLNSKLSFKEQTPSLNWKAPECFNPDYDEREKNRLNARFQSDIYSLGMCMFEAWTGKSPYEGLPDAIVEAKKFAGELPEDTEGKVPEDAWQLIRDMCKKEFTKRETLKIVISRMEKLMRECKPYPVVEVQPNVGIVHNQPLRALILTLHQEVSWLSVWSHFSKKPPKGTCD
ncbi:TPA: hypothetical protein N0F65_011485 [Lagenidium giganteum]|uniref:Protein kinase domain-containing protein n=1 Tax=Lagenidium giganteum TaxID=4803 RepID=A0AAV2ZEA4_9STRA|nr:TPA: hypothetical protein N0F65_011485 [Lagenidium giganteum]